LPMGATRAGECCHRHLQAAVAKSMREPLVIELPVTKSVSVARLTATAEAELMRP